MANFPENDKVKQLSSSSGLLAPSMDKYLFFPWHFQISDKKLSFSSFTRKKERIHFFIHEISKKSKETQKINILERFLFSLNEEDVFAFSIEDILFLASLEEKNLFFKIKSWKKEMV